LEIELPGAQNVDGEPDAAGASLVCSQRPAGTRELRFRMGAQLTYEVEMPNIAHCQGCGMLGQRQVGAEQGLLLSVRVFRPDVGRGKLYFSLSPLPPGEFVAVPKKNQLTKD
jgi:hypothetical protein